MAFTTVPTVVVGQLHTAAMWNTYVRDNANWYGTRKWLHIRRTTTVSLTNNTTIGPIAMDTEVADTGGYFTAGGTSITIPTGLGGIYSISFKGTTATTFVDNGAFGRIIVTGTPTGFDTLDMPIAGAAGNPMFTITIPINAAGTISTPYIFQNSGAAVTLNSAAMVIEYLGL